MAGNGSCRLIVGLGNPGAEYAGTRHNAGFEVVDRFLARHVRSFRERNARSGEAREGSFAGEKLIILKPLTFMNCSGSAVRVLSRRLGIAPEEILVISDDLDLPVGRIRMRRGGSDGGHNGLKSIIAELESASFLRLRIGIGRPQPGKTVDYVLTGFEGTEAEEFKSSLDTAVEAVKTALSAGISTAMNKFNAAGAVAKVKEVKEN